jgi:HK97 family phage portal protein
MNLIQKAYNKLFSKKSYSDNPSASLAVLQEFTNLLKLTNNYGDLAKTGYIENVIANTCIRRTCEAMNEIPLKFFEADKELESGQGSTVAKSAISAINNPSMDMDKDLWLESIQSQIFITGESYIYPTDGKTSVLPIVDMANLRPDRVTKRATQNNRVFSYRYQNGDSSLVFERTRWQDNNGEWTDNEKGLQGRFNVIHLRTYNPQSDYDGLSRLGSCALAIEGHNNALGWNNSIMQNAGKSSGMLSFGHNEAGSLDPEAIKSIADKIKNQTTGKNRGSILVSNAPAKFEKFNMTSQEMDFIEGIVQRAIDICNALDYPPYLLGLNGATFNNQAEAKLSLYENSAIPKTKRIYNSIATFISLKYGIDFRIECDISKVEAMAPRYAEKNDNVLKQYTSNAITLNEAREKLGYEEDPAQGSLYYGDFNRGNSNQNQET